jgi:hypothetical protein
MATFRGETSGKKNIRGPASGLVASLGDVGGVQVSWTALVPDVTPLRGPRARGFRAVFTSRTVAYLGSQGAEVALLVQAQRITGSPLVVGTLGLAELVPLVVFGLYGGVLGSYLADLAAMIFAYPNAMLPFLAAQLHAPWSTGLMFAAPSAGAFAVSATSGWMPRVRRHGLAVAVAAAGWGAAMALVGLAPDVYVALACLAVAGGADECSAVFRDTMWKQSIPDHLRGRMAGIELLSYAAGPPAGQLRSGAVAAVTSVRFSLTSGGLACVAAVAGVAAALPAFRGYTAPLRTPVGENA